MSFKKSKILLAAGILLLLIPLYLLGLWIYACSQTSHYPQNQQLFRSLLPVFLRDRNVSNLISLPFCALALLTNLVNLTSPERGLRIAARVVVVSAALLTFLNLWSMM